MSSPPACHLPSSSMKVGVKNRILNMQSCLTSTVRYGRAWSEYQATATIIHRVARYDATRLPRAYIGDWMSDGRWPGTHAYCVGVGNLARAWANAVVRR